MIQKIFPLDKNYILRQAQSLREEALIDRMIFELKCSYTTLYNPLQLIDETYLKILDTDDFPRDRVRLIYRQLSGIYRYTHGENQLEMLFDGRSHLEKFQNDWSAALVKYISNLGTHGQYVKTMLRMTVLFDTESRAEWAENHCKSFINQQFEVKIIKRKGELILKNG
jgi:hypothetical protein